jgi:hypothetical protein
MQEFGSFGQGQFGLNSFGMSSGFSDPYSRQQQAS